MINIDSFYLYFTISHEQWKQQNMKFVFQKRFIKKILRKIVENITIQGKLEISTKML